MDHLYGDQRRCCRLGQLWVGPGLPPNAGSQGAMADCREVNRGAAVTGRQLWLGPELPPNAVPQGARTVAAAGKSAAVLLEELVDLGPVVAPQHDREVPGGVRRQGLVRKDLMDRRIDLRPLIASEHDLELGLPVCHAALCSRPGTARVVQGLREPGSGSPFQLTIRRTIIRLLNIFRSLFDTATVGVLVFDS